MAKRILFSLIAFCALCVCAMAQSKIKVSGSVKDSNGEPLVGVSVVDLKNKKVGTLTDAAGQYTISVPSDATLEFSCLSYKTAVEPLGGRTKVDVVLKDDNQVLDATVVIGYGTSKKGDLTGSVSVVNMDEIDGAPVTTVAQALQGKVAGAEFSSGSGEAGESGSIRIRGSRSISASNEPLIVVDGVVDAVTDLGDINPSDIVSISVLKDVSSTAIYGSRGANGVILVTTQDSKRPEGVFSTKFKSTVGVSHIAGGLDLLNASEFAQWRNMCAINLHRDSMPYPDPEQYGVGTDWIKSLSRVAVTQNYYLSLYGSVGKTYFTAAIGYNDTPGVVINSGIRKVTGALQVNSKVSRKVTVTIPVNYTLSMRDRASCAITGTSTSAAVYLSPLIGLEDTWNKFGDSETSGGMPFNSPYLVARNTANRANANYFNFAPSLKWDISSRMFIRARFSAAGTFSNSGYYSPSFMAVAKANQSGGTARRGMSNDVKLLGELTYNYKRKIRDNEYEALVGLTAEHRMTSAQTYSGTGFTNDALSYYNMSGAFSPANFTPSSYENRITKLSALGRFNYNYKRRYYLTLTARADGASNFARNRKWGFFPAAAFRWSLMNENWFARTTWLNDLSLRLSAGRSGNDAISPYMSLMRLSSGATSWLFGEEKQLYYAASKLDNSNLTWETTDSYNVGFNFSAWNSRVTLEADAYLSNTRDLLLAVRNTQTTGFDTYYSNAGSTRNMGVEFTLTTKNVVKKNFSWTTTLTISHNNQIVTDVGSEYEVVPTYLNPRNTTQYMYGYKKGYPVNALWGYQFEGVWHNQDEIDRNNITRAYVSQIKPGSNGSGCGHPKYADINHDGLLDKNDVVFLGSADPVVYGGFQNNFIIAKRLNVGIYFTYSIGGYIYNLSELWAGSGATSYNKYRFMLNAWTEGINTNTDVPKAGYDVSLASSRSVYDASFLRLKTLSVSYSIPLSKKAKKRVSAIDLGINCDNLFLLKNYPGFDPDVNTSSAVYRLDNGSYPRPRTYAINFQIKF